MLTKKEARRSDRFTQLALTAAHEAVEQAGWIDELPYEPRRIGCVVGTGIGGLGTIEDACTRCASTVRRRYRRWGCR